jgi:hypothetical protein
MRLSEAYHSVFDTVNNGIKMYIAYKPLECLPFVLAILMVFSPTW